MRASYVIGSAALCREAYANAVPPSYTSSSRDPTITEAPRVNLELLRRQNDNQFIGWYSANGIWQANSCNTDLTYFVTASTWMCCRPSDTRCEAREPLRCVAGTLIFAGQSSGAPQSTSICSSLYPDRPVCNTGYVYENMQDPNPETRLFCDSRAIPWSFYRLKPAEATPSTTSSFTSSSSPPPTSITGSSPPPTTDSTKTQTNTPGTPLPGSDSPQNKKKKSQAWIAGAVVGPLLGLAFIGALIFLLMRRKKNKTTVPPPSTAAPSYPGSPHQQQIPQPYTHNPYPMQQNQYGVAPYGVAGAVKHDGQTAIPGSPHTMQTTSPHLQHGPYAAPPVPPQELYGHEMANPSTSPAPKYADNHAAGTYPHYSSELDNTQYSPPPRQA